VLLATKIYVAKTQAVWEVIQAREIALAHEVLQGIEDPDKGCFSLC
jgi:hypothetical protein